jgi:hypothetical protein
VVVRRKMVTRSRKKMAAEEDVTGRKEKKATPSPETRTTRLVAASPAKVREKT